MHTPKVLVHVLLLLAGPVMLGAQVSLRTAGSELGAASLDIAAVFLAPVHASWADWRAAARIGGGLVTMLPFDDEIDRWITNHPNAELFRLSEPFRKSHREGSKLGADSRMIPLSGGLVGLGLLINSATLREVGYGCLSTSVASTALRSAVYAGISRTRPVVADGDQFDVDVPGGDYNQHSFFSGHTMNAFGCATFLNTRYHLGLGEPVLYAAAAAISMARMNDRFHWSTDVYIGTIAGVAVGRVVGHRARRRADARSAAAAQPPTGGWRSGLRMGPTPGGFGVSWEGTF